MIKCLTKVAQKIGAFWGYLENIAILVKKLPWLLFMYLFEEIEQLLIAPSGHSGMFKSF